MNTDLIIVWPAGAKLPIRDGYIDAGTYFDAPTGMGPEITYLQRFPGVIPTDFRAFNRTMNFTATFGSDAYETIRNLLGNPS